MASIPAFNRDDPILDGLSQEQLTYLNAELSRHVNDATAQTTRVLTVNKRIKPPFYNPNTMSAASFFSKCEKYFRAQGYQKNQYQVHIILKHNVKLWYDSVMNRIDSLDNFKEWFAQRFDKPSDKERSIKLYTSKQRNNPGSDSNQNQNSQRRIKQTARAQCRRCKQNGHFNRDCPQTEIA
ncbi:unnamed protein product [Orchesella dallaii]|uniref:CCHC-type domain-containing protein n=1 Tax=Orchesella dallaii TaxID=48710 RepID=A0ABP1RJ92_9HEXA